MRLPRRIYIAFSSVRHRALLAVSPTYRVHDRIVSELATARRDLAFANVKLHTEKNTILALNDRLAEKSAALDLATLAREESVRQLLVERALRDSAEVRAELYHNQVVNSMERQVDFFATNRPGGVYGTREEPVRTGDYEPIHAKPHARMVAQQRSAKTLLEFQDEIIRAQAQEE